jgi:acetyl esterase/lipase
MPSEALAKLLDTLRSGPSVIGMPLEEFRALDDEFTASLPPTPDDVTITPTSMGGVPANWHVVEGAEPDRVLLYLHGGGYMSGTLVMYRDLANRLTRASSGRVLLLDYRLGPECPFPGAVEDAVAAYRALLAEGIAPGRIAVAGDSAGGGLTAALLVALRDAGDPLPAGGALLSAWTDLTCSAETFVTKAEADPIVPREMVQWMAELYLQGQDARQPLASPLYADLAGLPPLLVQVGTAETLLDDSLLFAERARNAGVEVTLEVWEEMIHVWHIFAADLPEGQEATERVGDWVRSLTAVDR